jgi:hypothetical protein
MGEASLMCKIKSIDILMDGWMRVGGMECCGFQVRGV